MRPCKSLGAERWTGTRFAESEQELKGSRMTKLAAFSLMLPIETIRLHFKHLILTPSIFRQNLSVHMKSSEIFNETCYRKKISRFIFLNT